MVEAPKRIKAIKFGLLSPDIIRKMSVTAIVTADTYDEDGAPIDGGLMDKKLGSIEPGQRCPVCGNTMGECPGHFGHLELARPVIHVGFVKLIHSLLKATCHSCGRVLIPQKDVERYLRLLKKLQAKWPALARRLNEDLLKKALKTTTCPHCKAKQYKIKLEKPTTFYEERKEGTRKLTPIEVRERLEKIPDADVKLLGLDPEGARPEWMVCTVLPIPPVIVRPSIFLESGIRAEDDLTHKLADIVRINERLRENIEAGAPELIIEDLWDLLQYHVTTYFDNEVPGIPPAKHRSGRPLRTLAQRLKGKEGRFRGHLSGKRVDFSARTVISPDPNISINEVGVPVEVAKILTVPEKVTPWNMEELRKLILNGPYKWPGANYIIRPDGRRIDLRFVKDCKALAETITVGYTVERHLRDGDIVLFNRQPSLHRMSIMAHRVKVLPGKTFRLNLAVCVSGDTKVLLDGIQIKIKDLHKIWDEVNVATSDNYTIKHTKLAKYWKIKAKKYGRKCLRIWTETGQSIVVTEDHPFYTTEGIKRAGELKVGDYVITYPMEFPEYEFNDKVILTENEIRKASGKSRVNKVLRELKEKGLIPLKLSDARMPAIARIVGHMFGDGTLIVNERYSRAVFRGTPTDLNNIIEDLKTLGYEVGDIKCRESKGKILKANGRMLEVKGEGCSFEVRKKSLCVLLKALGCPIGDKTKVRYRVPKWIMEAPLYIKKEFLASYFGSELSKPLLRSSCKKLFRELAFKVSKVEEMLNGALEFVNDIRTLLKDFGITKITFSIKDGNIRKNGNKTKVITIRIYDVMDVLGKIGYAYNRNAEIKARLVYSYMRYKRLQLEKLRKINALALNAKRGEVVKIANKYGLSVALLYRWRSRNTVNIRGYSIVDFINWVKEHAIGGGFVKERIVKIREVDEDTMYDITTCSDTHNFIANTFLTGNCPPYNADFDGDEMNLHVPQSVEGRGEARTLMLVQTQILSPRYGGPIIGALQDYISGAYLLTLKSTLLTKEEVAELLTIGKYEGEIPEPAILSPKEYWPGKQVFSLFLPKDFSFINKTSTCIKCETCFYETCPYDAYLVILKGRLVTGVLDKKAIGAQVTESMLHRLIKEYGEDYARMFLDNVFRVFLRYIEKHGFTMKLDDVIVPEEAIKEVENILKEAERRVYELIDEYKKGELEPIPGRTHEETLELRIMEVLADARDKAGEIAAKYLKRTNHAYVMAMTGARGNILNLTQMSATLGQQSVRGQRIVRGYTKRTLPHFKAEDLGPAPKGFVYGSFSRGLSPVEMFFHAAGGREGLVDTAVRTSQSGYMQRRLINALQDLKVEYDGTVRLPEGHIVQFRYGEDGADPSKTDHGKAVNIDRIIQKILSSEV